MVKIGQFAKIGQFLRYFCIIKEGEICLLQIGNSF